MEADVEIELAEALSLQDMVLSNLTTTAAGKPLVTDGLIFFNATAGGEQLFINQENPIYIEIPINERKPGMMVYKGVRDENGNMDWAEPKEPENYLVPIDLDLLDFYPENFELSVEKGMPFRQYKTATQGLKDSLLYSLSHSNLNKLPTVVAQSK